jgi:hypothetical protein
MGYGLGAAFLGITLLLFRNAPGAAGCWVALGQFVFLPAIFLSAMSGGFNPSDVPVIAEFVVSVLGTLLLYLGVNTLYKEYKEGV